MATSVTQYNKLLQTLGRRLLTERSYHHHHMHGLTAGELRELVHHLLVTRPPLDKPTTEEEELYAQVDRLLELEKQRQTFTDASKLSSVGKEDQQLWKQLSLWKGDITTLKATAIVNAANSALLGCFQPSHKCIDNVIHSKAGPRLRAACNNLMMTQDDEEPVGVAKITPAFSLPSSYVLHTVGPQLPRGQSPTKNEKAQLQSCYTSCLDLLLQTLGSNASDSSIAFPCISTGLFSFPSEVAVPLVVDAVLDWLRVHPEASSWKIVFNTFLQSDFDLYRRYFEAHCAGADLSASIANPLLDQAATLIQDADYLLITAGAGLSAAAGLDYTSEEVMKLYHPSLYRQGMRTMYSMIGRDDLPEGLVWGYCFKQFGIARMGWVSRRTAPTYPVLKSIRDRFEAREPNCTFVVTSNADGMFGQEGFPLESVYTKQGDYGFLQCTTPCSTDSVWETAPFAEKGLQHFDPETAVVAPEGIPRCPNCGGKMFLCLRAGSWFLDSFYAKQKQTYKRWLASAQKQVRTHKKKLVILEIGVGFNTPGVIRMPDERIAAEEGVSLIRVNAEHPEIPFGTFGVGLSCDANEALNHFAQRVVAP